MCVGVWVWGGDGTRRLLKDYDIICNDWLRLLTDDVLAMWDCGKGSSRLGDKSPNSLSHRIKVSLEGSPSCNIYRAGQSEIRSESNKDMKG